MTGFLDAFAEERSQLLQRTDELEGLWRRVQTASAAEDRRDGGLVGADLARLRTELERRTFTIGLFGLIKRGKSTLLNALLGHELSPTHVTPETAVPVYVEHGESPGASVLLTTGERRRVAPADVAQWTSQKHNPANERGVVHVRWRFPSPLLRDGVRLVDTPGMDDAEADDLFTRRTVQELDTVDAGIVVFLTPPTVGATEMAFLRDVTAAHLRKTVLVANMYPQHYHDPDTRAEVLAYVADRVTEHTGARDVRLHPVCAEAAWEARRYGDEAGWREAGGAGLLAAVEEVVAANTGRAALSRAQGAFDQVGRMATAAVEVRLSLLDDGTDPDRQAFLRDQRDQVTSGSDTDLSRALGDLEGTRAQMHALVHQAFLRARARIAEADSRNDLDQVLRRFTREVEVVTEEAFRKIRGRVIAVHDERRADFDATVAATLHDLGAVLPGMHGLQAFSDGAVAPGTVTDRRDTVSGAAVGGLVAGGAGVALVGSVLGPIGFLAGALVGWRLGGVVQSGRSLRQLQQECDDRLDEVAQTLLDEFDRRVDDLVAIVRESTRARRDGFGHDLSDMLELLERHPDPADRERAANELRRLHRRLELLVGGATVIELEPRADPVAS